MRSYIDSAYCSIPTSRGHFYNFRFSRTVGYGGKFFFFFFSHSPRAANLSILNATLPHLPLPRIVAHLFIDLVRNQSNSSKNPGSMNRKIVRLDQRIKTVTTTTTTAAATAQVEKKPITDSSHSCSLNHTFARLTDGRFPHFLLRLFCLLSYNILSATLRSGFFLPRISLLSSISSNLICCFSCSST